MSDNSGHIAGFKASVMDGAVVQLLLSECTTDGLVTLAGAEVGDMRRAAIVCLGLRGSMGHCPVLARLLWDDDAEIVQLAENSLWQLWMRAGSAYANAALARAVDYIRDERYDQALALLERLCAREASFAEAHDQRGISLCFLSRPDEAASAFRQTLRLNKYHFSAAVSLAHTYAERCDVRRAWQHYRYALRLHPRLDGIPEIVARLEACLRKGRAVS